MMASCGWIDDDVIVDGTEMNLSQPLSFLLLLNEDGEVVV